MHCATETPLTDPNLRLTWTTSALSNLLLASVLRLQMWLGRKNGFLWAGIAATAHCWSPNRVHKTSLMFSKITTFFGEQNRWSSQAECFSPNSPRIWIPDSFHFGIGPNQSQFTAGFASGLVFSCIILDSLFQPSIFHKSLISLVLGKADVLIYILRFSVEFNVLAENPHNTEHECQVTTTVAGAALQ